MTIGHLAGTSQEVARYIAGETRKQLGYPTHIMQILVVFSEKCASQIRVCSSCGHVSPTILEYFSV